MKNNVKVGDQVYCKKSFRLSDISFTEGLLYSVTDVNSVYFYVLSNDIECAFTLGKDNCDAYKFADHFHTMSFLKKLVNLYS